MNPPTPPQCPGSADLLHFAAMEEPFPCCNNNDNILYNPGESFTAFFTVEVKIHGQLQRVSLSAGRMFTQGLEPRSFGQRAAFLLHHRFGLFPFKRKPYFDFATLGHRKWS